MKLLPPPQLLLLSMFGIHCALCTKVPQSATGTSGKAIKKTGRPRGAKKLDHIDYRKFTSLGELVDNRPQIHLLEASARYMHAFANHADIKSIDLTQSNKANIAHQFYRLRDPQRPAPWQKKLTLSTRQYLEEAKEVDEKTAHDVLGYEFAQRQARHEAKRILKIKQTDPEGIKGIMRSRNYYSQHGTKRQESRQTRKQFAQELTRLTAGLRLPSASDVTKKADSLQYLYPKESRFSVALRAFLKANNYSQEDITMALGARAMEREKARLSIKAAEKTAKRRGQKAAPTSGPRTVTQDKQSQNLSQNGSVHACTIGQGYKKRLGEGSEQQATKRIRTGKTGDSSIPSEIQATPPSSPTYCWNRQ